MTRETGTADMTAPTGIGQYVRPERQKGDRKKANDMVNRPMLLWAREIKTIKKTKYSAEPQDGVFVDFVDLQTGEVFINVMWMAGAIVDGLRAYVGDANAYPTIIKKVEGGDYEGYNIIEAIEDQGWLDYVTANFASFHQSAHAARAAKEAEWATAMATATQQPPAAAAPAGPPSALTPAAAPAPPAAPAAPAAPPAAPVAPPAAPPAAPVAPPPAPAGVPAPPAAPPAPPGTVTNSTIDELNARLASA